jgi:hypothetical protein
MVSSSEQQTKNMGVFLPEMVPEDRRLWKRFIIGAACVLAVKPSWLKKSRETQINLGPLKNVGMKGLSFYYLEKKEKVLKNSNAISISVPEEGLLVENLPFRIVDDFYVARLPGQKKSVEKVKTLCVCFKPLLPKQRVQLEAFINDYGTAIKLLPVDQNGRICAEKK